MKILRQRQRPISVRRARAMAEAARLQVLIDANRARLAELEASRECRWCKAAADDTADDAAVLS